MEEKHCKNFSEIRKGPGLNEIKPKMYENISKALMNWLLHLRNENIPVNGLLLKEEVEKK